MKTYLTATDIAEVNSTIEENLQFILAAKVKAQLTIKLKEFKNRMKFDSEEARMFQLKSDEQKKQILLDYKNQMKDKIINSKEFAEYRQSQYLILKTKAENYSMVRTVMENLNELNEFSADVEKLGLQTLDEQNSFESLISKQFSLHNTFENILSKRKANIQKFVKEYENKTIYDFEVVLDNDTKTIRTLNELYDITKDYDDIDFYEKYGMLTNLDLSNDLGDFYILHCEGSNRYVPNIINRRVTDYRNSQDNHVLKLPGVTHTCRIISNKLLGTLLINQNLIDGESHQDFVTSNQVTCYSSMYATTANNKHTFTTRTLGELLIEITDPNKINISKQDRKQIYSTYDGTRPKSNEYHKWNGLQVFDIDLKEWHQVETHIQIFKKLLFEELSKYHWFLCIAVSASGRGLHIYTKVSPAHHMYTEILDNEYISKYWFTVNYVTKASILFDAIKTINYSSKNSVEFKKSDFNDNFELRFVDNVVSRITAGIRLTSDINLLVNENFLDLHPGIMLYVVDNIDENVAKQFQHIKKILLRDTKLNNKLINLINSELRYPNENKKTNQELINLEKYDFKGDLSSLEDLPRNSINYTTRYNVCNTLAALFGKDGIPMAHVILQSEACGNVDEINSFYACALTNSKEPSKLGLDILKRIGLIKKVTPEVKKYSDNIFKDGIRKSIESVNVSLFNDCTFMLRDGEYLGNMMDYLLDSENGGFTNKKINILLSPAGSGKTAMLLKMARDGKRILLVEPFISVIKNKVESDEELMKIFEVFYESKSLNDADYGVNAITTFDKFSTCNYEKVSRMYDYICIDESHLLFTSGYRINATSSALRKIKELYYISANDPFAAKLILMTGTETGDTYFFGKHANVIQVGKQSLSKEMKFLICGDMLDCVTRLSFEASELIKQKYRLLIPTNKGEIYSQKLIGMVEHLLGRPVKYGYYKRSNTEQEICRLINKDNTVGDYEIIFCSNYLSVGVDIVDKHKFASIYFGPFSGYEIEQFNARIRKTGIKSIYCVQTELADGSTNDLLLEEPNLALNITDEDISNFKDDKALASAKQEFIAQYDPILHKIVTPGFGYLNGSIRFNKEEYELLMFEQKFVDSMIHPIKVARELAKYGYRITASDDYEGLAEAQQEELKQVGIEAAKEEKVRKHNLLVGTYLGLIENNYHVTEEGLEFYNIVDWIGKHKDAIIEDRTMDEYLHIEYNLYGNPVFVYVKSKEALEKMYNSAKYIISKYSLTKAKELILQYVDESGVLKQKQFIRSINLMKLIDKSDTNELSEPMFKMLDKMYNWMDKFQIDKNYRISYNTYMAEVDAWTNSYIDMLNININTTYGFQKVRDNVVEMLNDIGTKNTSKNGIRFEYNSIPDEDGKLVTNKRSVDNMIEAMFKINAIDGIKNTKIRNKHVVLEKQEF